MLAPIVLFAYNRPIHTQNALDALSKNKQAKDSMLYVFCDGPKINATTEQLKNIEIVRLIARQESRFKSLTVIEQPSNKGLANSIIDGVTEIVNKHDKIIVLEDDLITSPHFLKFMNEALEMYEDEEKIISIGSCNYFANDVSLPSTLLLPIVDCLGWATWKNRWVLFDNDSIKLKNLLIKEKLVNKFNFYGSYNFMAMLDQQITGNVDSWAVRWTAVACLNDKLTLYPNPSLTHHINSLEGTHASALDIKPPMSLVEIKMDKKELSVNYKHYVLLMKGLFFYFEKRKLFKFLKKTYIILKSTILRFKIQKENKLIKT
jgi:hypothetical protein